MGLLTFLSTHATERPAIRLATPRRTFSSSLSRSSKRPLRNLKSLSVYVARPSQRKKNYLVPSNYFDDTLISGWLCNIIFTRVGIVCIKKIDFFSSISIHIAGGNSNSISCLVSQSIVWRVTVINSNVYQLFLSPVILQHQVGPVVPERKRDFDLFFITNFCIKILTHGNTLTLTLTLPPPLPGHHHHPHLSQPSHSWVVWDYADCQGEAWSV